MNKKTKIYYTLLLLVLGVKVVTTIFSNGLSVHHGKKIAQLQVQKDNLQQQQIRLSGELSNKSSISYVSSVYDLSEFITITKPIILITSSAVASN